MMCAFQQLGLPMTVSAPDPRPTRRQQGGVTLVELVITIIIISVAVAGVMTAFSYSVGRSADPLWQTKAMRLAQLYLDEILTKPYDEDTPAGGLPPYSGACRVGSDGESRAAFDDVDDYDGVDDQPPVLLSGTVDDYSNYRVQVSVACAGGDVGLNNGDAKRITVTVTPPGLPSQPFAVYRGHY